MFEGLNLGTARKRAVLKHLPPIPATEWTPPQHWPDLRDAALIAVDTETKENDWPSYGWARGSGHIVGFSVAALHRDGKSKWKGYFPVRHEVETHLNFDAANAFAWLKWIMETPVPKTGANLIYDIGWLGDEGITPGGTLYDVQFAEALLTGNASDRPEPTNLDHLAYKYLGEGKVATRLYDWLARAFGGAATGKQRSNIYRAPPQLVGPYAEGDATKPLDIFPMQWTALWGQGMTELYEMECRLIRLLIKMRQTGVRIDLDYANKLYADFGIRVAELERNFARDYGRSVNVNSALELEPVFKSLGIAYPRTEPTGSNPKGVPSFQKDWLKNLEHPIGKQINAIRELDKLRSTFIKGYMLEKSVKGRVHCSFNPLKGEGVEGAGSSKGAKTGRFASNDPNLQNIPIRTKEGAMIRAAFIPDHGHEAWEKCDYSQIEYRMLAHFAVDDGDGSAQLLRDTYNNDVEADYHDIVYDRACPYMGWDATDVELRKDKRRPIKNTNFGLLYGQGQGKLARTMGLTPAQSKEFFVAYHSAAPYVKPTMAMCEDEVHKNGFVTTILGRKTHFKEWVPFAWGDSDSKPLPFDLAVLRYGSNIQRAYGYRAVNYKFQGSAADKMKRALDLLDQSGVFDVIGVPKLTVHDELDFSVIDRGERQNEAYRFMRHTMETAIPLRVPVRVDAERGPNWGAAKEKVAA